MGKNGNNAGKKLLQYLRKLGEANYCGINLSDIENPHWAYLELTLSEKVADGLEAEINSHLVLEAGFRAKLRFRELRDLKKNKYIYAAHIIPEDFVPKVQWEDATEDVLKSLPRIIRNYMMKK